MEDEAAARNLVLHIAHGRMPSYALWHADDVARETRATRIEWWDAFSRHKESTIARMADHWTSRLAGDNRGVRKRGHS